MGRGVSAEQCKMSSFAGLQLPTRDTLAYWFRPAASDAVAFSFRLRAESMTHEGKLFRWRAPLKRSRSPLEDRSGVAAAATPRTCSSEEDRCKRPPPRSNTWQEAAASLKCQCMPACSAASRSNTADVAGEP